MDMGKMNGLLDDLQQFKDELTVKANLGQAEAKEELEKLEPFYDELKAKIEKIGEVAGDSASELKAAAELGIDAESKEDISTALELATENLKSSYEKIKKILS